MLGCVSGQPSNRWCAWMFGKRCDSGRSSIAPRRPCWRGSSPIASYCFCVIPEVMKCENPPSPSGTPIAAYRAPASCRAASASRSRTGSKRCSAAIVTTTSLTARSARLSSVSAIPRTIRPVLAPKLRRGLDERVGGDRDAPDAHPSPGLGLDAQLGVLLLREAHVDRLDQRFLELVEVFPRSEAPGKLLNFGPIRAVFLVNGCVKFHRSSQCNEVTEPNLSGVI